MPMLPTNFGEGIMFFGCPVVLSIYLVKGQGYILVQECDGECIHVDAEVLKSIFLLITFVLQL